MSVLTGYSSSSHASKGPLPLERFWRTKGHCEPAARACQKPTTIERPHRVFGCRHVLGNLLEGAGKIDTVFLDGSIVNLDSCSDNKLKRGGIATGILSHTFDSIERRSDAAQRNAHGKPAIGLGCNTL